MSVIIKSKRWNNHRVPYVITVGEEQARCWLLELNKAIGYSLLAPKEDSDTDYLDIKLREKGGSSENIGNLGGRQKVGASSKSVFFHELFHALGFKHEQLHKKFPWVDAPELRRVNRYKPFPVKPENQTLYNAILDAVPSGSKEFFASNNLWSRLEAIKDKDTEHWESCDINSVMIYPEFKRALINAGMNTRTGVITSSMDTTCDALSNQDVAALLYMYPKPTIPTPPAPRMRITFNSAYNDDSLQLTFWVRSTRESAKISRYIADKEGQMIIDGFNPVETEIRVEPFSTWTRLKVDKNTSNALSGGRYSYTVTLTR